MWLGKKPLLNNDWVGKGNGTLAQLAYLIYILIIICSLSTWVFGKAIMQLVFELCENLDSCSYLHVSIILKFITRNLKIIVSPFLMWLTAWIEIL
jgi:hypothetical protein